MFITLEDETDIANLIVWPSLFDKLRRTILGSQMMVCRGRVQCASGVTHIIAEHLIDQTQLLNSVGGSNETFTLPAGRGPQTPRIMVEIGAGSIDRRMDHDELGDRIDANVLPLVTDQRELTPVARKEPEQIAIAEQLCGFPGNRQASGAFNNAIGRLRGGQTTKKYTRWLMISVAPMSC